MSLFPLDPQTLNAANDRAEAAGKSLAAQYQSAKPFHHICIDDFLPLEVVQKVREEALSVGEKDPENSSPREHLKTSYNPEPVNHPEGDPRLSIALYYYTPTWSDERVAHSTLFRPRLGSDEKAENRAHRRRFAQNVRPPVLYRKLKGPLNRLGF